MNSKYLNKAGLKKVWDAVKARDDAVRADLEAEIAKRSVSIAFDTFQEAQETIYELDKGVLSIGDMVFIREGGGPDMWVSGTYVEKTGDFGYYELNKIEADGVDHYLSLNLNASQEQALLNGAANIPVYKRWAGQIAIYFFDEFAIYLKTDYETPGGDTGNPVFMGNIPEPNTRHWKGFIQATWDGVTIRITKGPKKHVPISEQTLEEILQ